MNRIDNYVPLSGETSVNLGRVVLPPVLIPALHASSPAFICEPVAIGGKIFEVTALRLSRPHAVIFSVNLGDDISAAGPVLERHPVFPEGADVVCARVTGESRIAARVWKQGREVYGSLEGAGAALAAASLTGRIPYPEAYVDMQGVSVFLKWERFKSGNMLCVHSHGSDNDIAG